MDEVSVGLSWDGEPALQVEQADGRVVVVAHPGLSEAQVAYACGELGDLGPAVLAAWRTRGT